MNNLSSVTAEECDRLEKEWARKRIKRACKPPAVKERRENSHCSPAFPVERSPPPKKRRRRKNKGVHARTKERRPSFSSSTTTTCTRHGWGKQVRKVQFAKCFSYIFLLQVRIYIYRSSEIFKNFSIENISLIKTFKVKYFR